MDAPYFVICKPHHDVSAAQSSKAVSQSRAQPWQLRVSSAGPVWGYLNVPDWFDQKLFAMKISGVDPIHLVYKCMNFRLMEQ